MKPTALLREYIAQIEKARDILSYSVSSCGAIPTDIEYTYDQLDKMEAMTSRFARLSDLLIQKVFRLIIDLELEEQGTVRDRIHMAEKLHLIENSDDFVMIRELRNTISHEYEPDALREIFKAVLKMAPVLINSVEKTMRYCLKYF